jgi:hypothetical protein
LLVGFGLGFLGFGFARFLVCFLGWLFGQSCCSMRKSHNYGALQINFDGFSAAFKRR